MEVQQTNDKMGHSSYRKNLLDAMAKSSIKYVNYHKDATKPETSSMLVPDHHR